MAAMGLRERAEEWRGCRNNACPLIKFTQSAVEHLNMPEDRASNFLQMIRRAQRGRLKIYLGYGPGVGKTYLMLTEGQRLARDGTDVVVGYVETHGRAETAKLVEGLKVVPRRTME